MVDLYSDLQLLQQELIHSDVGDVRNAGFHAHVELKERFDSLHGFVVVRVLASNASGLKHDREQGIFV